MQRLAAPLLAAASLAACASLDPAPRCDMARVASQRELVAGPAMVPGESSPLKEMPMNSVNITDKGIIAKVLVRSINARRTDSGTAEITAQVVNCTDYPLTAEARTQFYDKSGAPSEPVSAWQRLHLAPLTASTYGERSLGDKAVDGYMIEMRESR